MKRLFKSVHFIYMFVLLIWQFLICAANLAISQFPKFAWMRMCVCAQVVTDVAGDFLDWPLHLKIGNKIHEMNHFL